MDNNPHELKVHIHKAITKCFNLDELALLCFDFGLSNDEISGNTITAKAREIIEYFYRQGRLTELISYCASKRPRYAWPKISDSLGSDENLEYITSDQVNIVKVLFLAADPTDASRLRLGQEFREIHENIRLSKTRNKFSLVQRFAVRPRDISQAILDEEPQIVHFSGHGTDNGSLCFEDELGKMKIITPDSLADLFQLASNQVTCVLINACYSIAQANAISAHIRYVIGMNNAISDRAAISFAVGFYQALGAGKSIEDAYKFGCVQIKLQGIPDQLIPILMKKE